MNQQPGISESDVAAIRQQNDLKAFMKDVQRAAADRCAARRALVHRYPDLVERLHKIPGQRAWNGYIPPDTFNGQFNDSPIRAALVELVTEAETRTAPGRNAA